MEICFSKNLKKYVNKHNLSLKDLGQKLDVPTSTVHGWINGIPPRNIFTIKKIASLLECSVDELCFDDGSKVRPQQLQSETALTIMIEEEKYQIILVKMK